MTGAPSFAVDRPEKPYPGLRPFEAREWSIFFGRERMIDEVIDRLACNRLVLIHGASGSGKSSLVRAGIMPKLARQHRQHGTPWLTCAMRPAGGPLWNLATELARLEGHDDTARIGAIVNAFNRRDVSLAGVVGGIEAFAGKSLCILIDQFEELFRFEKETSREEAELFVELIVRATREETGADVHVVVTMRSEFLGQCARFAGLAEVINATQYLVPRMDDEALLRAVRRPAQVFKGLVGEDLAYRLIARVRGREDELPLLQHGLMLMWDEAVGRPAQDGRIVLDGTMVETADGLAELLSDHADRVMDGVAPDPQRARIVETVFRELTDVNAEGSAIRRPRTCADLAAVAGTTVDELRPLLDAFRAPGVSFLTPYAPEPIGEATIIDISHEALIRCWGRLGSGQEGWLKQELDDGLAWRLLLAEAAAHERHAAHVLVPGASEGYGDFVAGRNEAWSRRYGGGWPVVGELLEASSRAANSTRRRSRIAMGALVALAASAVSLAYLTTSEWRQSEISRNRFEQQSSAADILTELILNNDFSKRDKKDVYTEFFSRINYLAQRGNVVAENSLGVLYYNGLGVPRDYNLAYKWLSEAANAGFASAMMRLGLLYEYGQGVPQDYAHARELYEKAAAAGNNNAVNGLGLLYEYGRGVPQDYGIASKWYQKAADAGNSVAMRNLGILYENGRGVLQDHVKARDWFEKAASAGDTVAMGVIWLMYAYGVGVRQNYSKAREWDEKAVVAGDGLAMEGLGLLYENGHGVPQDYGKAREWYEKAAAAGNNLAMNSLGLLYENGYGVPQDYGKARAFYEKAAAEGNYVAMNNLGFFTKTVEVRHRTMPKRLSGTRKRRSPAMPIALIT